MSNQLAPSLTHCQVCGTEFAEKKTPRALWERLCSACSQDPKGSRFSASSTTTTRPSESETPGPQSEEQPRQPRDRSLEMPPHDPIVLGTNPKDLLGMKKVRLSLVPPSSIVYQALAMEDGARKYGPYNWRENAVIASIYVDAAMRHLQAWFDGEETARDSGKPHLGHALACLGILVDALETGNLKDDRPKRGVAADLIEKFTKKEDR